MVVWVDIAEEEENVEFRVVPLVLVVWLEIADGENMEFRVELLKLVNACDPGEVLA